MSHRRNQVELFVDEERLVRRTGLERVVHPATKHPTNPVFGPGEGLDDCNYLTPGTVRREAGRYRM